MVAILTKYIGPTDYRGSRCKALHADGGPSLTVDWDHAKNVEDNHQLAAFAFARKMGWSGRWVGGGTRHGYAFVNTGGPSEAFDTCRTDAYPPEFVIGKR